MKKRDIIILMAFGLFFAGCQSDRAKPQDGDTMSPRTLKSNWVDAEDGDDPNWALGPMNGWYNNHVWMAYYVDDAINPVVSSTVPTEYDLRWVPWGNLGPTQTENGINLLDGIIVMGTGHTAFYPTMNYPGEHYVYMRGFYPHEGIINIDPANPRIDPNDPTVEWELTGQQDVMISNVVWGRNKDNYQFESRFQDATDNTPTQAAVDGHPDGRMEYHHLLSRIGFRLSVSTGWPTSFVLTDIELRNVHNRVKIDLTMHPSLGYSSDQAGGDRLGWLGGGLADTDVSHFGYNNPNTTADDDDGMDGDPYDDGEYGMEVTSGTDNSFWTSWPSPYFNVSEFQDGAWSTTMAYMMMVPYENFEVYFHFYNKGDGTREIIPLGNIETEDGGEDITQRVMKKGYSYTVFATLQLVNAQVLTHAYWEEEVLDVTSPGVGGGSTVGGLNPDENRLY